MNTNKDFSYITVIVASIVFIAVVVFISEIKRKGSPRRVEIQVICYLLPTEQIERTEQEIQPQPIISPTTQLAIQPDIQTANFVEYEAEITGYCPCKKCCGKYADGITASGKRAVVGMVAADKSLPFGTKVFIEGFGFFTVEDRGGAIKGRRFDIFRSTHKAALKIGRSMCKVRVYNKYKEIKQ